MKVISLLLFLAILTLGACGSTKSPLATAAEVTSTTTDTIPPGKDEKADKKEPPYKDYDKVITKDAISQAGMFAVHRVDDDYYFEIPFSELDTDVLLVSRIAKIPSEFGGGYVNAGSKTNEQVIHWERSNNNLLLRSVSYSNVADEALPINLSVQDNNYAPVIASFKIEAFGKDSTTAVIKVNDLFVTDVPALSGISKRLRKEYEVRSLDKDRSFISRMSSFPENVEVRHDMTYTAGKPPAGNRTGTISMQLSQSFYRLPEIPMQPRQYDERVGWFTVRQVDFSSEALKADEKRYIRRWRMEPTDAAAYARGELVEPKKPIVYYLDPATPEKFRKYFRQGIEDWQVAFEAAGFKNAIVAKDAPTPEEDPDWSAEDARYSTVRYVASTTRNAVGPSVSDPRSGEIIESDIIWYHNHLRSYRNRYLLETGAANPSARTLDTPEEEIGEMMRRVISHEVGHALGLPHNMKASYAYPTDSLRSATFTQKWGLASTIMDYTRYNYVAQPGDEGVRFVRMLGPYDTYAINWGYRVIPGAESAAAEKSTLNKWITNKADDPVYRFGGSGRFDPSSQTESVGDDPIKASTYGMKNLEIVANNLADWTTKDGENYDDLSELYGEMLSVWSRYAGHVTGNIGGIYEHLRTVDEPGQSYTFLNRGEQKAALEFLNENVFQFPGWLLPEAVANNVGPDGFVTRIRDLQSRQLGNLLRSDRLMRMVDNEARNGRDAYTAAEMMDALRKSIWSEVSRRAPVDAYRRNLQRAHVERLGKLLVDDAKKHSDVGTLARAELTAINKLAAGSARRYGPGIVRYHLEDVAAMTAAMLDPVGK
ncbi:zinc-dependent metalloprotease [Neolewinella antarctica]|uniref:Zinc-dependent metalloprotease n=1 Tax=Neolewinella antarctica TaxID=442734 RepID=A0ABX0XDQ4_9BACT|nr:zinc-dependent metalloprotease [Neolewinella antarctica]NJC27342.1 hypothetical protein [Neolewinella antarctica]